MNVIGTSAEDSMGMFGAKAKRLSSVGLSFVMMWRMGWLTEPVDMTGKTRYDKRCSKKATHETRPVSIIKGLTLRWTVRCKVVKMAGV